MVSDRRTAAGDNGEAFFRYLRKNHPDLDARFVIRKESGAYIELSKIGKVIENDTIREKLTALVSDYMISSQGELQYINPLYQNRGVFRDLMADKRFVFLQHGIIKDDLSDWLMRPNKNFYGFVTSTKPEYQSILEGNYGYTEKEIWLTGLPRYDRLSERKDPKLITVMPTWRRYLMAGLEKEKMRYSLIQDFEQSEFFRFYHDLLSDPTIIKVCEQYGYQLAFLPHPAFQPYLDHFHDCRKVHFFGVGTDYRSVYSQSALVVTDYSSAIFDAVYLGCPVVYAHFDHEQFFAGEHIYQKGYFDYERDGFGEVEYDLSSTVNRIVEYMQTGCKQKDQYRKRAERISPFIRQSRKAFSKGAFNYEKPADVVPCVWEIEKAVIDPLTLEWSEYDKFVYDGQPKSVRILNLPDDAEIDYDGAEETPAGKYLARGTLTGNYRASGPVEYEWEIAKASYDMGAVRWGYDKPFDFDRETHEVTLQGVPEELGVRYRNQVGISAGDYKAVAMFINPDTHNYFTPEDMTLNWTIRKKVIDMSGVKWNYQGPFTYDGETKSVELTGVPEGIHVDYENASGFNVLWGYFGWANQALSVFTLWTLTVYLAKNRPAYFWVTLIPALFMTAVCTSFIVISKTALGLAPEIGYCAAAVMCAVLLGIFLKWKVNLKPEDKKEE